MKKKSGIAYKSLTQQETYRCNSYRPSLINLDENDCKQIVNFPDYSIIELDKHTYYIKMEEMQKIRLVRKFNCKRKITYQTHLLLIIRVQIVYELLVIIANCLANWSFHFHLSHVYTSDFWTTQNVASSNFGLALTSLLIIPYTLLVEDIKSMELVKDIQISPLFIHFMVCTLYNMGLSVGYVIFVAIIGSISIGLSTLMARIVEGRKLHREILQIEREDRKSVIDIKPKGSGPMSTDNSIQDEIRELVKDDLE